MDRILEDGKRVVYVAGAYSAGFVMSVFQNMEKGISLTRKLIQEGASVFCPFIDFQFFLAPNTISLETIQQHSLDFVARCDAVVLTDNPGPNSKSKGTIRELHHAMVHEIPIFGCAEDYLCWARGDGPIVEMKTITWEHGSFDLAIVQHPRAELPLEENDNGR